MRVFIGSFFFIMYSTGVWAGVKDTYNFKWLDPKKKVFVLQDKVHENKKKFNIDLGYGVGSISDFQDSTLLGADIIYFFNEEWGLEVSYYSYSNSNNDSYNAVQNPSAQAGVVPHVVRFDSVAALSLVFSPFYGKLNTFNLIYYLDWSFSLGAASFETVHNTTSFLAGGSDYYESESNVGAVLKTKVKFHVTKSIKLGLSYINHFVNIPSPELGKRVDELDHSSAFFFTLGFKI